MAKTNKEKISEAIKSGSWLDVAWNNISKTKFVGELFAAVRQEDSEVAEQFKVIDCIRDDKPETWIDLNVISPLQMVYVAKLIHDERHQRFLRPALLRGFDLGRPLADLVHKKFQDMITPLLCASANDDDRDAAYAHFAAAPVRYRSYDTYSFRALDRFQMACGFASQNDPRGDEVLLEELALFIDGPRRSKYDGFGMLPYAVAQRRESPLMPQMSSQLARCLTRGIDVALGLCDLASALDDESLRFVGAVRQQHSFGDHGQDRAKRVSADAVLAHAGQPVSADDARWFVKHLQVERYAWPSQTQYDELMRLCAKVLEKVGTADEKRWAAKIAEGEEHREEPQPSEAVPPPQNVTVVHAAPGPFMKKEHINCIAVSPDGELLCAVGDEGGSFFDRETGERVRDLQITTAGRTTAHSHLMARTWSSLSIEATSKPSTSARAKRSGT